MQVALNITNAAPQVPPVRPRSLFQVAAFPEAPSGFSPSPIASVAGVATRLLRFADVNGDGSITRSEAASVAVRDEYTTEEWDVSGTLRMRYLDATVTYDASAPLRLADTTSDGRVTRDELVGYLLTQGRPTNAAGTFGYHDETFGRLEAALYGAMVIGSVLHGVKYVAVPW